MTHRRSNVYLSHAEPRCEPSQCDRKDTCARYLAPLPPSNATIADFSINILGVPLRNMPCDKWVSSENKPLQPPPVIRRHTPIGSGS